MFMSYTVFVESIFHGNFLVFIPILFFSDTKKQHGSNIIVYNIRCMVFTHQLILVRCDGSERRFRVDERFVFFSFQVHDGMSDGRFVVSLHQMYARLILVHRIQHQLRETNHCYWCNGLCFYCRAYNNYTISYAHNTYGINYRN